MLAQCPSPARPDSSSQDATFTSKVFRNALGNCPTGVTIVTTQHRNEAVGLTCNSFASVSLEPALVLWSLRKESSALHAFRHSRMYAINLLSSEQEHLSRRFAASALADKFAGVGVRAGRLGLPLIDGCVAHFECRTHAELEAGDHLILIGKVIDFDVVPNRSALLFCKGDYQALPA